ncbi:hypothetical protein [Maridesulfovibrio sp.]|uniref:hypothetical protein n=1 Tax=Maridesulfovibrio sp. TaxID=2795000 RepID=UPI002A18D578|nr:hypothetical protein [Maridesulfovibrio sp.]
MSFETTDCTPFDYSDSKRLVYFEFADKTGARETLEGLCFIDGIEELKYGFNLMIAMQQIPEVIRCLTNENIAIYTVEVRKSASK